MPTNETWMAKVEALAPKEQETLLGTSLSRRFARLPLWLSHPANIGGFYGLLIALALLLPYAFGDQNNEVWGVQWIYHTSLLLIACGASGFLSLVMISLSKRHPMAPPRQLLYPMPFVGLALLSIDRVGMMDMPSMLVWALLLLPGPVYVHLSWAPRWRLLCMIEDGKDPFVGLEVKAEDNVEAEEMVGEDTEILEVVDAFESE
ncbi:MAG: hypothetical protein VXY10_03450 [Candidatus Thermoplasmatota archaeon]|nr:hypothetical protein [Candidatus Thermoplasmatota archaeon]MEC8680472.1 hypothetical protein [Candidatus Thermoplasmatota archaeon]